MAHGPFLKSIRRSRRLPTLLGGLALILAFGCARNRALIEPQPFDPAYPGWNETLVKFATPEGVDYAGLAANPESLQRTIAELRGITPHQFETWSRPARLACLINAHNAYAVKRIVDRWPVDTVEDTRLLFEARNAKDVILFGRDWSLQQLSERIMSDEFMESRAIFLLNWGERGCAPLPVFPITELNLRDLLDRQTRAFVNNPAFVRYELHHGTLHLSPLLKTYREELMRDFTTLWVLIGQYLPEDVRETFTRRPPRLHWLPFDHSLNSIERAAAGEDSSPQAGTAGEPGEPAEIEIVEP